MGQLYPFVPVFESSRATPLQLDACNRYKVTGVGNTAIRLKTEKDPVSGRGVAHVDPQAHSSEARFQSQAVLS
jgi:hypothetical protein